MRQKIKKWLMGSISSIIICCSTYLPSSGAGCFGTTCGACTGGCFSVFGILWIILLYLKNGNLNTHQKVVLQLSWFKKEDSCRNMQSYCYCEENEIGKKSIRKE